MLSVERIDLFYGAAQALRGVSLKAETALYRNTELDVCVPFACRDGYVEGDPKAQLIEKIGGPAGLEPATTPL